MQFCDIAYPLHFSFVFYLFLLFFSLFIFFSPKQGFPVHSRNIWSQESISVHHGCVTSLRWFRNSFISCLWVTQSSNIVRLTYGTCLAFRNVLCYGVTIKFKYFYNSLQPSRVERSKGTVGFFLSPRDAWLENTKSEKVVGILCSVTTATVSTDMKGINCMCFMSVR